MTSNVVCLNNMMAVQFLYKMNLLLNMNREKDTTTWLIYQILRVATNRPVGLENFLKSLMALEQNRKNINTLNDIVVNIHLSYKHNPDNFIEAASFLGGLYRNTAMFSERIKSDKQLAQVLKESIEFYKNDPAIASKVFAAMAQLPIEDILT
jgi:hypothetical protein